MAERLTALAERRGLHLIAVDLDLQRYIIYEPFPCNGAWQAFGYHPAVARIRAVVRTRRQTKP
jgi:hypothetical protein